MSNIKKFSSRKEVSEFLATKDIDTSTWSEEKWLQINKGQAEIHMMELAEQMWDAMNESTPKELKAGEWHIPFYDQIETYNIQKLLPNNEVSIAEYNKYQETCVKVSTAMCARISYTVVEEEGKKFDYQKDIELHDKLAKSGHWSPFEHCAKVPTEDEYRNSYRGNIKPIHIESDFTYTEEIAEINLDNCGWFDNFHGFIPYRKLLENANK